MAQQDQGIVTLILRFLNEGSPAAKQAMAEIESLQTSLTNLQKTVGKVKPLTTENLADINASRLTRIFDEVKNGTITSVTGLKKAFKGLSEEVGTELNKLQEKYNQQNVKQGMSVAEKKATEKRIETLTQLQSTLEGLGKVKGGTLTAEVFKGLRESLGKETVEAEKAVAESGQKIKKAVEKVAKDLGTTKEIQSPFKVTSRIGREDAANAEQALKRYSSLIQEVSSKPIPDLKSRLNASDITSSWVSFKKNLSEASKLLTELEIVNTRVQTSSIDDKYKKAMQGNVETLRKFVQEQTALKDTKLLPDMARFTELKTRLKSSSEESRELATSLAVAQRTLTDLITRSSGETDKTKLRQISKESTEAVNSIANVGRRLLTLEENLKGVATASKMEGLELPSIQKMAIGGLQGLTSLKSQLAQVSAGFIDVKNASRDAATAMNLRETNVRNYEEIIRKVRASFASYLESLKEANAATEGWTKRSVDNISKQSRHLENLRSGLIGIAQSARSLGDTDFADRIVSKISKIDPAIDRINTSLNKIRNLKLNEESTKNLQGNLQKSQKALDLLTDRYKELDRTISSKSNRDLLGIGPEGLSLLQTALRQTTRELQTLSNATGKMATQAGEKGLGAVKTQFEQINSTAAQMAVGLGMAFDRVRTAAKNTSQLSMLPELSHVAASYHEIVEAGAQAHKIIGSFANFLSRGLGPGVGEALKADVVKYSSAVQELENKLVAFRSGAMQWSMGIAALGATVMAPVVKSISTFSEFDDMMVTVNAITNSTQYEFEKLTKTAEQLGEVTRFTTQDAAMGMKRLGMAGFNAAQQIAALPSMLDLAQAGALQIGDATENAANILTSFEMKASEMTKVADVMVKAFTSSNSTLTELGIGFKYVGSLGKGMGTEFEDLVGAVAKLHDAGFKGSMAGTALRGAIEALFNPTAAEARVLGTLSDRVGGLGLQLTNSRGQFIGFEKLIRQLEEAGFTSQEALKLFGQRAGPGMAALLRVGSDALEDYVASLKNSEGTATRIAREQEQSLKGKYEIMTSALEATALSFGTNLAPGLKLLIDGFTTIIEKVNRLREIFSPITFIFDNMLAVIGSIVAASGALALAWIFMIVPFTQFLALLRLIATIFNEISAAYKARVAAGVGVVATTQAENAALKENVALQTAAAAAAIARENATKGAAAAEITAAGAGVAGVTGTAVAGAVVGAGAAAKGNDFVPKKVFEGAFADAVVVATAAGTAIKAIFSALWQEIKMLATATFTSVAAASLGKFSFVGDKLSKIMAGIVTAIALPFKFLMNHPVLLVLTAISTAFLLVGKSAAVASNEIKIQGDLIKSNQADLTNYLEIVEKVNTRFVERSQKKPEEVDRYSAELNAFKAVQQTIEELAGQKSPLKDKFTIKQETLNGFLRISAIAKETNKEFLLYDQSLYSMVNTTEEGRKAQSSLYQEIRKGLTGVQAESKKVSKELSQKNVTAAITNEISEFSKSIEKVRATTSFSANEIAKQQINLIDEQNSRTAKIIELLGLKGLKPDEAKAKVDAYFKEIESTFKKRSESLNEKMLSFSSTPAKMFVGRFGGNTALISSEMTASFNEVSERLKSSLKKAIDVSDVKLLDREKLEKEVEFAISGAIDSSVKAFDTLKDKVKQKRKEINDELEKMFSSGKKTLEIQISTKKEELDTAVSDIERFYNEQQVLELEKKTRTKMTVEEESKLTQEAEVKKLNAVKNYVQQSTSLVEDLYSTYKVLVGGMGRVSLEVQTDVLTRKKSLLEQELSATSSTVDKMIAEQRRLAEEKKALLIEEKDFNEAIQEDIRKINNKGKSDTYLYNEAVSRARSLTVQAEASKNDPEQSKKYLEQARSVINEAESHVDDKDVIRKSNLKSMLMTLQSINSEMTKVRIGKIDEQADSAKAKVDDLKQSLKGLTDEIAKLNTLLAEISNKKTDQLGGPNLEPQKAAYKSAIDVINAYADAVNLAQSVDPKFKVTNASEIDQTKESLSRFKDVYSEIKKQIESVQENKDGLVSEEQRKKLLELTDKMKQFDATFVKLTGKSLFENVDVGKLNEVKNTITYFDEKQGKIKVKELFDTKAILEQFRILVTNSDNAAQQIVNAATRARNSFAQSSIKGQDSNKIELSGPKTSSPVAGLAATPEQQAQLDYFFLRFKENLDLIRSKKDSLSKKTFVSDEEINLFKGLVDNTQKYAEKIKGITGIDLFKNTNFESFARFTGEFEKFNRETQVTEKIKIFDFTESSDGLVKIQKNLEDMAAASLAKAEEVRRAWIAAQSVTPEQTSAIQKDERLTGIQDKLKQQQGGVEYLASLKEKYAAVFKVFSDIKVLQETLGTQDLVMIKENPEDTNNLNKLKGKADRFIKITQELQNLRKGDVQTLFNKGLVTKEQIEQFDRFVKLLQDSKPVFDEILTIPEGNEGAAKQGVQNLIEVSSKLKEASENTKDFTENVQSKMEELRVALTDSKVQEIMQGMQSTFSEGLHIDLDDAALKKLNDAATDLRDMKLALDSLNAVAQVPIAPIAPQIDTAGMQPAADLIDGIKVKLDDLASTNHVIDVTVNVKKQGDGATFLGQKEGGLIPSLSQYAKGGLVTVKKGMESISNTLSYVKQYALGGLVQELGPNTEFITDKIKTFSTGGSVTKVLEQVQKFALGGMPLRFNRPSYTKVPGSGEGDKVPALLEPGEYIIKKSVVKKLGDSFFNWVNAGALQLKSTGGIINNAFTSMTDTTSLSYNGYQGHVAALGGGAVQYNGGRVLDELSISLKIPGTRDPVKLKGSRDQVNSLVTALKVLERGLPR